MFLRFSHVADGPGPSEILVRVRTCNDRTEEVVISKRQDKGGSVEIGTPLLLEDDRYLVELPRESTSGKWRIWVPQSEVSETSVAQAAE